jgi:hypothetical protein
MNPKVATVRAGIFIGVDKCGDLQRLNDTAAGATRMHQSAASENLLRNLPEKGAQKVLLASFGISSPLSDLRSRVNLTTVR